MPIALPLTFSNSPPGDMTPPSPFAAPERLLALGSDYSRHRDALSGLLYSGTRSADTLGRHIPRTQALARDAREFPDVLHGMLLYRSPEVSVVLDRVKQLAVLAITAADHLFDAVDFLRDAPPPHTRTEDMTPTHRRALWEAGRHKGLALGLTALGADDCLESAGILARQMRLQRIAPEHQPPPLSLAQHATLHAIARGDLSVDHHDGKVWVERSEIRVSISTVRALEARGLVTRETCPLPARADRIHLTPQGHRTLAASLGRSHSTAPTPTRAVPRSAATAARSAAR